MKIAEVLEAWFNNDTKDVVKRHAPAVYHLPDGSDTEDDVPRDWVVMAGSKTVLSGKTRAEARKAAANPMLIKKYGKLHIAQKR